MRGNLAVQIAVQARIHERLHERAEGETIYTYYIDGSYHGTATVDRVTRRVVLRRLFELTDLVATEGWKPETKDRLGRIGHQVYSLFVPPDARRFLASAPAECSVALDVQDHDVPWELMHDGTDYIARRLMLGRRLFRPQSGALERPKAIRMLVVGDPDQSLDGALAEAIEVSNRAADALGRLRGRFSIDAEVVTFLGEEATKESVYLDMLANADVPIDVFHYAGHGEFDSRDSDMSGLALADGYLRGFEVRSLGSEPFVFANACRASSQTDPFGITYGGLTGLAGAFLAGGATAYLAPSWAVSDDIAQLVATTVYDQVISGVSIGRALAVAKRQLDDTDVLAYVLFGDPMQSLHVFAPRLALGPFVNAAGIQRIIGLEREYPALELLAVNDLPWILWDDHDIAVWTDRMPIDDASRAQCAAALRAYVMEFGTMVRQGARTFVGVVNLRQLREYLASSDSRRVERLVLAIRELSSASAFILLLFDPGLAELEEIEVVSRGSALPPLASQSAYVFNKQTRFESSAVTYNLYEDYNPDMIERYIESYAVILGAALRQYDMSIDDPWAVLELATRITELTILKLRGSLGVAAS